MSALGSNATASPSLRAHLPFAFGQLCHTRFAMLAPVFRPIALCFAPSHCRSDPRESAAVQQEIHILASLEHPFIIRYYDSFIEERKRPPAVAHNSAKAAFYRCRGHAGSEATLSNWSDALREGSGRGRFGHPRRAGAVVGTQEATGTARTSALIIARILPRNAFLLRHRPSAGRRLSVSGVAPIWT